MKLVVLVADPDVRINQDIALELISQLQSNEPWQLAIRRPTGPVTQLRRSLEAAHTDALVMHSGLSISDRAELLAPTIPWVNVANDTHPHLPVPVIIPDHEAIGKMAADYLVACRFEHLATVGFAGSTDSVRFRSFREKARQSGRSLHEFLIRRPPARRQDHPAFLNARSPSRLTAWLRRLPKPCGILAYSDQPGAHVISACVAAGIRIPEEVSVLGIDDDPLFCRSVCPNLSSVHISHRRMGAMAADLIMNWEHGRRVINLAPSSINERQSVRPPKLADPLVNKALDYLQEHAGATVRARDLQTLTGLTPQMLTYRFRKALGVTPMEEILRRRIMLARQLLSRTTDPVATIAVQSGFNSTNQFYVTFRNQVGMSPRQYRAEFKS